MNLWQMLMANRGLMDVAGKEELGGGSGDGEPAKEQIDESGTKGSEHTPGTDDAHKQARQPEDDEYAGLSPEQLIAKLREAKKSGAELLKESMKRKEKLAAYGDIDPDRARRLVDAEAAAERTRQEAEQAELERRGEFDAVKKQMVAAHQSELQVERDARNQTESENAALKAQLLEMTVGASFSGSSFLREKALMTPAKARVIYGNHFEVGEDGALWATTSRPVRKTVRCWSTGMDSRSCSSQRSSAFCDPIQKQMHCCEAKQNQVQARKVSRPPK